MKTCSDAKTLQSYLKIQLYYTPLECLDRKGILTSALNKEVRGHQQNEAISGVLFKNRNDQESGRSHSDRTQLR